MWVHFFLQYIYIEEEQHDIPKDFEASHPYGKHQEQYEYKLALEISDEHWNFIWDDKQLEQTKSSKEHFLPKKTKDKHKDVNLVCVKFDIYEGHSLIGVAVML